MSSKSVIEIVKADTMRSIREYRKHMLVEFKHLSKQMDPLYERLGDKKLTAVERRRLERLEKRERRHMTHIEQLEAILAELGVDESSYC